MENLVDISYYIRNNEELNALFNIRENIILGKDVKVPENVFSFYEDYAKAFRSNSKLIKTAPISDIKRNVEGNNAVIWYSGGSDSVFMHTSMPIIPCRTAKNFIPNISYKHKHEFQLMLVGSYLGYNIQFIGVNSFVFSELDNYEAYEFSDDFIASWNKCFSSKIVYPLSYINKPNIYEELIKANIPFNVCEKGNCGSCYKCFEYAMTAKAVAGYSYELPFKPDKNSFIQKAKEIKDILENNKVDGRFLAWNYMYLKQHYNFDIDIFLESL